MTGQKRENRLSLAHWWMDGQSPATSRERRADEREKCELLISWPLFPISVSFLLLSTARTPDWNAARRTAVVGAFAKRPWTWRRRIGPSVLIHLFQLNWHLLLILFLSLPTNNTKSTFSLPFWPSTPVLSLTHSTELEYAAFLHRVHFRMPSSSVGEKKRERRVTERRFQTGAAVVLVTRVWERLCRYDVLMDAYSSLPNRNSCMRRPPRKRRRKYGGETCIFHRDI